MQTDEKVFTDNDGNFKIRASVRDELRFVKENFERKSKIIQNSDFFTILTVQLTRIPIDIDEVKVVAKLTGNLTNDAKFYPFSKKTVALNDDIRKYEKKPFAETQPQNNIPSFFAPRDPYEGQINLLRISIMGGSSSGLVKLLIDEAVKKDKRKPKLSKIQSSIQE